MNSDTGEITEYARKEDIPESIHWGDRANVARSLLDTLEEESPMPYAELAMLGILYPRASGGAWIIGPPLGHIQEALRVKVAEFDLLVRVQDFLADLSPSERSALDRPGPPFPQQQETS